jgi:hypothetical protein
MWPICLTVVVRVCCAASEGLGGFGPESGKGRAILNEPELERELRAEPLNMGPRQGHAPATARSLPGVASFRYNYVALLLDGYCTVRRSRLIRTPAIPTEVFSGFPQSLQANEIVP